MVTAAVENGGSDMVIDGNEQKPKNTVSDGFDANYLKIYYGELVIHFRFVRNFRIELIVPSNLVYFSRLCFFLVLEGCEMLILAGKLFPYADFFKWMSYGNGKPLILGIRNKILSPRGS